MSKISVGKYWQVLVLQAWPAILIQRNVAVVRTILELSIITTSFLRRVLLTEDIAWRIGYLLLGRVYH